MKTKDLVKFAEIKERGDEQALFQVLEMRGERVLVADMNSTETITPTFVYLVSELVVING